MTTTTYYRVGDASENIFETWSVELATDLHGVTEEEIFELYGVSDEEELNDTLPAHLWFDPDGHFGAGVYYYGVCCAESLENLKSYFSHSSRGLDGSVISVFKGEYIGRCGDGDVVIPTEVIGRLPIDFLDK